MPTFKHSGAIGDLLYCLPVVRAMGGGDVLLDVGPSTCFWHGIYGDAVPVVSRLLEAQPYVGRVAALRDGDRVDHDLDRWRSAFADLRHPRLLPIPHMALMAFGLPLSELDSPWLSVPPVVVPGRDVVVCRTARYRSRFFRWRNLLAPLAGRVVFVGLPAEYDEFVAGNADLDVAYAPTSDLFDAAGLIAGCGLYASNQTSLYVVAEAMHKELILEVCPLAPNGLLFRPGASYHMFY